MFPEVLENNWLLVDQRYPLHDTDTTRSLPNNDHTIPHPAAPNNNDVDPFWSRFDLNKIDAGLLIL